MNIHSFLPSELLRPFVKRFMVIETENEQTNRVLPDTSLVLSFRYKGSVNYMQHHAGNTLPAAVFSGLRKSVRLFQYAENTGNVLVLFNVAGATAFFKEPLYEMFEESVSLHHFVAPRQIAIIEEQLAEAGNNEQRIAIIEHLLLSRLYDTRPDKLIATAIQKIYTAKGILKIKKLADALYISQDAFEKRFRKRVGTSPKQFSAIVRFRAIISPKPKDQTLTDMAYGAGYFDQSHFNKDFKLFTGQTPTDFFNNPSFW